MMERRVLLLDAPGTDAQAMEVLSPGTRAVVISSLRIKWPVKDRSMSRSTKVVLEY